MAEAFINIMTFHENSGIFLYSPGSLTRLRGIHIQKPAFVHVINWIETSKYPSHSKISHEDET